MTKRGAVQSYEGHVNSHTRLQLGVDQSERFVMAGLYHFNSFQLLLKAIYFDKGFRTYILLTTNLFFSGGEDCNLRLWSVKSGKLLYEEKISDSVLSTVCWKRSESKPPALYRYKSLVLHLFSYFRMDNLSVLFHLFYLLPFTNLILQDL